ncbi:MAG: AAA family ATPase [Kouleothrix sp.]
MQVTSFNSIADIAGLLGTHQYIADVGLSTSLFLALKMGKALLLEGEPGVGKTEVAKVLSVAFGAPLIRLQCYEGIDISQAVYSGTTHASCSGSRHASCTRRSQEEAQQRRPVLRGVSPAPAAAPGDRPQPHAIARVADRRARPRRRGIRELSARAALGFSDQHP